MKDTSELDQLIERGAHLDIQHYSDVQDWFESTESALIPFPGERQILERMFFGGVDSLEDKIEKALDVLHCAVDRVNRPEPEHLCDPHRH